MTQAVFSGAGPAGHDAVSCSPVQSRKQRSRRRPQDELLLNEPTSCSIQVPVRRRFHSDARIFRSGQVSKSIAASGEFFNEPLASNRVVQRVFNNLQEFWQHSARICKEKPPGPPTAPVVRVDARQSSGLRSAADARPRSQGPHSQ